jgi:hypothetical protein
LAVHHPKKVFSLYSTIKWTFFLVCVFQIPLPSWHNTNISNGASITAPSIFSWKFFNVKLETLIMSIKKQNSYRWNMHPHDVLHLHCTLMEQSFRTI